MRQSSRTTGVGSETRTTCRRRCAMHAGRAAVSDGNSWAGSSRPPTQSGSHAEPDRRELGWRKTRISLIETGRVRLTPEEAVTLADAYRLSRTDRAGADRAHGARRHALAGRRARVGDRSRVQETTATILENAGQTPREVADQLGHAQTSTTIDDYFGRRRRNPGAAQHLEDALRHIHEKDREESAGPEM